MLYLKPICSTSLFLYLVCSVPPMPVLQPLTSLLITPLAPSSHLGPQSGMGSSWVRIVQKPLRFVCAWCRGAPREPNPSRCGCSSHGPDPAWWRWPRALGPACCALQVAAVTDISFENRYCYNRRINQKLG